MTPPRLPGFTVSSRIVGHGEEAPDQLLANPSNFRRHPGEQLDALRGSMRTLGWIKTVIVNRTTGHVIDGHARIEEALRQELPTIPVTYVELSEEEEKIALAVLDPISELAYRDDEAVRSLLESITTEDDGLKALFAAMAADAAPDAVSGAGAGSLAERFGVPPFSVLDARQGYWQERKAAWLSLGIQSEIGRGGAPGGSPRPAADYSTNERGDGAGKPIRLVPGGGGGGAWLGGPKTSSSARYNRGPKDP